MIDLDPGELPAGIDPEAAVQAAQVALRDIEGACVISVAIRPHADGVEIRLYRAGTPDPPTGTEWLRVQAEVRARVQAALSTLHAQAGWFTGPPPAAAKGLAETMSSIQIDALTELAMLAQSVAPPPPRPLALQAPQRPTAPRQPPPEPDVIVLKRLLALVLRSDGDATAQAAIRRFGSYAGVLAAPEVELRQVPGLGTHSIAAIKLVHAAAVRLARAKVAAAPVLDAPDRLMAYLATALARERVEQFRILFLDERGMLQADEIQASGTVDHTPVYPREVVRRALELKAAALVLVHNHPSGDPAPSRADIEMTSNVRAAAAAMSIVVRDHVIVGNGRWLSFRDAGLLH